MDRNLTFDARDEFNRKQVADNVLTLLRSNIELSPMVIDGGWGKGKTEFCIKLINLMAEADTHDLIYIDAFKADHANDPLLAILSEVIKILPDQKAQAGFLQKVVPAVRYGLGLSLRAGVSHILRQDAADVVEGFEKEIEEASNKVIDKSVETLLKDHVEADKNLIALQTALQEISQVKPIIIFIDELDRCRPDFAVSFLEVIKHTLDVEGVDFVLVTNKSQLRAAINHCYGDSVDSHRYLDKFLKFTIQLPDDHSEGGRHYTAVSLTHYVNLVNKSELLRDCELDKNGALALVERFILIHDISLREIETVVKHLEIYHVLANESRLGKRTYFGYKLLCIFGVLLFSLKPDIAKSVAISAADAKDIGKVLGVEELPRYEDGCHPYPEHHEVVAAMVGQDCLLNSDLLTPLGEESIVNWENIIQGCTGGRGLGLQRGERIREVETVIDILNLHD